MTGSTTDTALVHDLTQVIEVQQLTRRFGATVALRDVTLAVRQGTVLGLVGENGAGKTTLIQHLLGLLKPQSGAVRVFGVEPVAAPERVLVQIGYVSDTRQLPMWLRVQELLDYWSAFYPNWDSGYAQQLLDMFELPLRQRLKTLSRGQLARAALLAAVAHRPPVLILDEPSSGLDPLVRRDILSAVIRNVAEEGRTVLFSSHLLEEVQRVSDHLVLLHRGEVKLEGALDDVLGRHVRVDLRLSEPRENWDSGNVGSPSFLNASGHGRHWTVVADHSLDVGAMATRLGADIVDQGAATFEDVFAAYAGGPAND